MAPPSLFPESELKRTREALWENNDPALLRSLSTYYASAPSSKSTTHDDETSGTEASPARRSSNFITKAFMQIPLKLEDNGLVPEKDVQTTLTCMIPPTANHGRWSATLGASSAVRGPIGCASGSATAAYHFSRGQLSGGLHVGDQASMQIGGNIRMNSSKALLLGMSLVSSQGSPLGANVSARYRRNEWSIHGNAFVSSLLRPNVSVSVANWSRHKLQLGLGWQRSGPSAVLRLQPKLSDHRHATLSCQWIGGNLNVGAELTQSLASKVASLGVGVWHLRKRLAWVFTWNRGDICIRVPIIISQQSGTLFYYVQFLYLSLLSGLIQEAIADLWNIQADEKEAARLERDLRWMKREKARADAEQQKQLMKKQAMQRVKAEEEKKGLVVKHAVYHVQGGDTWDVTTQLQFWTLNSALELPASSKQDLLGFYNVGSGRSDSSLGKEASLWSMFGNGHESTTSVEEPIPQMTVQYEFAGDLYEIVIQDSEPLQLPSRKAVPLKQIRSTA